MTVPQPDQGLIKSAFLTFLLLLRKGFPPVKAATKFPMELSKEILWKHHSPPEALGCFNQRPVCKNVFKY